MFFFTFPNEKQLKLKPGIKVWSGGGFSKFVKEGSDSIDWEGNEFI